MTDYIVKPIYDDGQHIESVDCPCRPIVMDGVIVHRSFDGREFDEEGHEITIPSLVAENLVYTACCFNTISKTEAQLYYEDVRASF